MPARFVAFMLGSVVVAVTVTSRARLLRARSKSWLLHASTCWRATSTAEDRSSMDILHPPSFEPSLGRTLNDERRRRFWTGPPWPCPNRRCAFVGRVTAAGGAARVEGGGMQYLLLIYGDETRRTEMPPEEQEVTLKAWWDY